MSIASPPNVLYVTSFARDMFAATGTHLIESFLATKSDGHLLCCHEGQIEEIGQLDPHRIFGYDLDTSEFLRTWLHNNRDIIPIALGGEASPCACPSPDDPHSDHMPRCPHQWFNKNASRWFRKIVSLEVAMQMPADIIVWLDSDCRFKRGLSAELWLSLFSDHSVLYHKSPSRAVLESGVIAFRIDRMGAAFLNLVITAYRNGTFRNELRWDDGYLFQKMLERHPEIPSKDLAQGSTMFDYVLPTSPLGTYLDHYKGVHGPVLRLMR